MGKNLQRMVVIAMEPVVVEVGVAWGNLLADVMFTAIEMIRCGDRYE